MICKHYFKNAELNLFVIEAMKIEYFSENFTFIEANIYTENNKWMFRWKSKIHPNIFNLGSYIKLES